MIKKLVQHGNSSALILDKTILQLLGADAESSFEIVIEGNILKIQVAPKRKRQYSTISTDHKKQAAYEKMMDKHSGAFEKLAKK